MEEIALNLTVIYRKLSKNYITMGITLFVNKTALPK